MHRHRGSDYYEAFQDFRDGLVEKDMELVLQKQEQFDRRWLKIGLAKTREVQEAQDTLENFQSTAWKEDIGLDGVMGRGQNSQSGHEVRSCPASPHISHFFRGSGSALPPLVGLSSLLL